MNWLDLIFIAIIFISFLISIARGFVRELMSLLTWILAFWAAFSFSDRLADNLTFLVSSQALRMVIGFIIIFAFVWLVGLLVSMVLTRLVDYTHLGPIDKVLGALFGVARGVLLIGVVILLGNMTSFGKDKHWQQSLIVAKVSPYTDSIEARLDSLSQDGDKGKRSQAITDKLQQLQQQSLDKA